MTVGPGRTSRRAPAGPPPPRRGRRAARPRGARPRSDVSCAAGGLLPTGPARRGRVAGVVMGRTLSPGATVRSRPRHEWVTALSRAASRLGPASARAQQGLREPSGSLTRLRPPPHAERRSCCSGRPSCGWRPGVAAARDARRCPCCGRPDAGVLTERVAWAGRSRMIARAKRSWAASERSGPGGTGTTEPGDPGHRDRGHQDGRQPPQQDLHPPMMTTPERQPGRDTPAPPRPSLGRTGLRACRPTPRGRRRRPGASRPAPRP